MGSARRHASTVAAARAAVTTHNVAAWTAPTARADPTMHSARSHLDGAIGESVDLRCGGTMGAGRGAAPGGYRPRGPGRIGKCGRAPLVARLDLRIRTTAYNHPAVQRGNFLRVAPKSAIRPAGTRSAP